MEINYEMTKCCKFGTKMKKDTKKEYREMQFKKVVNRFSLTFDTRLCLCYVLKTVYP